MRIGDQKTTINTKVRAIELKFERNPARLMKLIIFLWRIYNGRIFTNNWRKNQKTSEIVRNSRMQQEETVRTKEEVPWNVPGNTWRFKVWRTGDDVVGDEKDETVNVGKCCELLDERLVRSDEFVGQLKEELSIASYRDEAEAIWKENLIQQQRITRRREKEVKIEEIKIQMIKKGSEFSSS